MLTERGLDDAAISLVLSAWRAFFVAITIGDRSEFDVAMERAQALSATVDLPPDPSAGDPRAWYRNLDVAFDALPSGGASVALCSLCSARTTRRRRHQWSCRGCATLGSGANEIVVLPDVGHTMLLEERGTDFDSLRVGTFAPAFVALMNDWIEQWLSPDAGR